MNILSYFRTVLGNRRFIVQKPSMLTYIVTFRCNARCIMCDSWKKKDLNELTTDQIKTVMMKLPKMDIVRLSGGEPFVRKDIGEIAEIVRTSIKPSLLHITTNGILSDRIIEFLEKRNKRIPLFLLVSVDGMKEKHNEVRGVPVAWDRVNELIRYTARYRKKLNIRIAVNQTVVDQDGLEHYLQLNKYLRKFNINNNLIIAYDESATYNSGRSPVIIGGNTEFRTFGDLSKEDTSELIRHARLKLKDYSFTEKMAKKYYLNGIENRLVYGISSPNPRCVALSSHMRIYPDGAVPVCQFNSVEIGNILSQSFDDVWYGDRADKNRKWVNACRGCWAECEVLPSALFTGDIFRALA